MSSSWSPSEEAGGREASLREWTLLNPTKTNDWPFLPAGHVRLHVWQEGPSCRAQSLLTYHRICHHARRRGRREGNDRWSLEKKEKKKLFIKESGHYDCFPEAPLEWNQAQRKVLLLPIFTFSASDPRGNIHVCDLNEATVFRPLELLYCRPL